ncbi:MAG: SAM-dependent chlorinase/fluorinase [Candidatus Krumholzibacteriota bacterium]|nr:SAM-dependent chlorinase/fluorinase [Candidatus Krumholzibacteriota bacterium]
MAKGKPRRRPVIALMTDFTWHNWYLGVMKAVILGVAPDARIVDLCHDVSSRDVREGSFIIGNSYRYFPPGTVFCCVVDPGVGGRRKNIVIETDEYLFVGPDNGILSCVFEEGIVRKVYGVEPGEFTLSPRGATFHGRDIYAPIAAHLSLGVDPAAMGTELDSVLIVPSTKPVVDRGGEIRGRAVYVDTYGNIITDIDEAFLESLMPGKVPWEEMGVRFAGRRVTGVKQFYEQGMEGALMVLRNSWGYLEIAVNRGSAFEKLGLREKKSLEIVVSPPAPETTGA